MNKEIIEKGVAILDRIEDYKGFKDFISDFDDYAIMFSKKIFGNKIINLISLTNGKSINITDTELAQLMSVNSLGSNIASLNMFIENMEGELDRLHE